MSNTKGAPSRLFIGETGEQLRLLLRDNSDGREPVTYMRQFSDDELSAFKDELSEVVIVLDQIAFDKKEAMLEFKERAAIPQKKKGDLTTHLRMKMEEVKEDLWKFLFFENNEVGYYNSRGELVQRRPMRPDERQMSITKHYESDAS